MLSYNHHTQAIDTKEKCEKLGLAYHSDIKLDKLNTVLQNIAFFFRLIEEEKSFLDEDDGDFLPSIDIVQDKSQLTLITLRIYGSSFVFTGDDYKKFAYALSGAEEIRIQRTGKDSISMMLTYDLSIGNIK